MSGMRKDGDLFTAGSSEADGGLDKKPGGGGKQQAYDTANGKYVCIDLSDEIVPKSLGAKYSNHDIKLPNGEIVHLAEGTHITNKQVFAGAGTKTPIRVVERLVKQYGGKLEKWTKVKAFATLEVNGKTERAEIHWFEEPTIGKHEIKLKIQPTGDWWL